MATYYGYRLKFYCTADGPRAVFQRALDVELSEWQDASIEYEPDSTADPESVGATVSASGISLPTGSMTINKSSEAQRWVWKLDGTGNIPITIDTTNRGIINVSTQITWTSGHDDGMVGVWVGDAAPTAAAGGVGFFIRQTSSPNFNAERSYNDGSSSLFIGTQPDLTYSDIVLPYCDSVFEESLICVYNASSVFVDSTNSSTDLGCAAPAFAFLAGHAGTATTAVTAVPIAYLYWSIAGVEVGGGGGGNTPTEVVEEYYNALLLQDERLVTANISAADSSYTQSDRVPGTAVPSEAAKLIPKASGEQSDTTYDLYIAKGGFPNEAGFLWRETGEQVYGYIGQERETISQRLVFIDETYEPYYPSAITTKTGRVVVAYGTTSTVLIRTAYYDGGTDFDGNQTIVTSGQDFYLERTDTNAGTTYAGCCLLYDEVEDEILLFVRAIFETAASTRFLQIWTYSSKDNGVTFSLKASNTIKTHEKISGLIFDDFQFQRMGAIWVGRSVMLFLNAYYNNSVDEAYIMHTLVSHDYGHSFNFIEQISDDIADISCAGNSVVYRHPTSVSEFKYKRFYAVKAWSAVESETLGILSKGEGTDFGLLKKSDSSYILACGISGDGGDWDSVSDRWGQDIRLFNNVFSENSAYTESSIFSSGIATTAFKQLCLVEYQGGLLMFYKQIDGSLDDKFCAIFLGGYSNICLPDYYDDFGYSLLLTAAKPIPITFGNNLTLAFESFGTYPIDSPPTSIWTASGTDTLQIVVVDAQPYYKITASGASPGKYYTHAVSGGGAKLIIDCELGISSCAAAAAGSRGAGVEIDYDNGTTTSVNLFLETYIDAGNYKYKLKNLHASTSLYTGSFFGNLSLKFRIAFWGQKVRLFVSDNTGSDYNSITQWALVYSSDAVAMGTPAGSTFDIGWGVYSAAATETFILYNLNFIAYTGDDWDLSDVDDIDGDIVDYRYPISATSKDNLLTESLLLRWSGGPALLGDTYTLAPAYTYPIDNIDMLKRPSKSLSWKAEAETEQLVVYTPEEEAPAAMATPNLGWYIEKPNFKTAYLQARTTMAGAWTTLLTLNACEGFENLAYTTTSAGGLYGPGLRPDATSDAAARPIQDGELKGGYVICDNGVTTIIRPIRHNTEGVWAGSDVASKKPIIYVDDWDTAHGEGTLSIILPQHLLVLPDLTTDYVQFRIRIPSQDTYEGKFCVTKMPVGPVYLFARTASWGRKVSRRQNYIANRSQSGQRFAKRLGETQTVMQFSWAEYAGDDLPFLNSSDPDYISMTEGGEVCGFRESLPYLFESLHEQLDGPVKNAVLCLGLPADDAPIHISDPKKLLRGPIVSEYSRDANLGKEVLSEYWTISSFEMEEEK